MAHVLGRPLSGALWWVADPIDQSPHVAAGVAHRRRAVTNVFGIERNSAGLGMVVALDEDPRCGRGEGLATAEEAGRASLSIIAADPCGLLLEVQDEPQFDARVRQNDVDAMTFREAERGRDVRVLVSIEDSPYFVEGAASRVRCFSLSFEFHIGGSPHEGERVVPFGRVDGDEHPVAEVPSPRQEVAGFGLLAFDDDVQGVQVRWLPGTSRWAAAAAKAHDWSEVISSAAATNSCAEMIGVAP